MEKDVQQSSTGQEEVVPGAGKGLNQNHFMLLYLAITVALVMVVFQYLVADDPASLPKYAVPIKIAVSSMQNVALWFLSAMGFTAALHGLKCNLYDEVVVRKNNAVAILVVGAWVAIALVVK